MIAIIDVTGNNLSSLGNAIKGLGYDYTLTHDPEDLQRASHVILPGVGAAASAMRALNHYQLIDPLRQLSQPVLGICLGMQLLCEHSEEGDVEGLKMIPGRIKKIPKKANFPIPHMGWSRLHWTKESPLMAGLEKNDYVFFVHSYALQNNEFALATCEYSIDFTAIFQHNKVFGMQFHPEKSSETGLKLLNNFLKME